MFCASGEVLETDLLKKSMRLELEVLESFKVGESVSEKVAWREARKSNRRVLFCRWVHALKKPGQQGLLAVVPSTKI